MPLLMATFDMELSSLVHASRLLLPETVDREKLSITRLEHAAWAAPARPRRRSRVEDILMMYSQVGMSSEKERHSSGEE